MVPLPQIVPSQTCVQCDVCCRFPESDSFLRPYFTKEEIEQAVRAGLDSSWFPDAQGGQIRLTPATRDDGHRCPAYDEWTGRCLIYHARPLDCQIYPLALMWNQERSRVLLGWDRTCPFVNDAEARVRAGRARGFEVRSGQAMVPKDASSRNNGPETEWVRIDEYAEEMAHVLEQPDTLQIVRGHPGLIGPFQDDVLVYRELPRLTEVLEEALASGVEDSCSGGPGTGNRTWVHGDRPELTLLTLDDLPKLEQALVAYRTQHRPVLSAFGLPPHYLWRAKMCSQWTILENHLCLFAECEDGLFMVLPPLGPGPVGFPLKRAFDLMRQRNGQSSVSRVENIPVSLKAAVENLGYRLQDKAPEYVYRTNDLVTLRGDRYKSQRAAYNRFRRIYGGDYTAYESQDRSACWALLTRWREYQASRSLGTVAVHLLEDTETAQKELFATHPRLGLSIRLLRVQGAVVGYTAGFECSPEVFCIVSEFTDRQFPGAAQVLFREFARELLLVGYTYINTMDTFGLPHLIQSKQAYRPIALVSSWTAVEP